MYVIFLHSLRIILSINLHKYDTTINKCVHYHLQNHQLIKKTPTKTFKRLGYETYYNS